MHLLIYLLIFSLVVYLVWTATRSGQDNGPGTSIATSPGNTPDGFSSLRLAFISRGKLFVKNGEAGLQELQSPYVQGVMDRMEQARQRHGWKQGTAFESSFVSKQSNVPTEKHELKATTAQFTPEGKMLYFLRDNSVGGLFEYDLETGTENRLIHQQRLLLEDLCLDGTGKRLICSQLSANGTANVALMDADGSNYREVTGGDTVDSAPAWVPGEPDKVVYQSSGVARNEEGFVVALGPAAIQMLDLEKNELITVREEGKSDFLQPKVTPSGDLCFIRRPYEPPRYGGGNFLVDLLLFPFRLSRAVFHYLNFFSLMYTRKPLTSAAGPKVQADLKALLIKGKRIDAENALRKESRINGVRSLVPSSWQLVKRNRYGEETVLANNVASYDITSDGKIIFTNGYGVFVLDENCGAHVVLRGKLIAEVVTA